MTDTKNLSRRLGILGALGISGLVGCAEPVVAPPGVDTIGDVSADDGAEDGANDTFLAADGKADNPNLRLGETTVCALLKLAGDGDSATLRTQVHLSKRAVDGIIAHRDGADRLAGTSDDEWFETLGELDAIPYVGPATFKRMVDYVGKTGYACGSVAVKVLAFNDFHGALKPPAGSSGRVQTGLDPNVDRVDAGGVEYLATHLSQLAAGHANAVVVSAGDTVGATPLLSALFHDEPSIEAMNLLGLEISAVGNHEFDEGWAELLRLQNGGCHPVDGCQDGDGFQGADFQYLAANVIVDKTGDTLLPSYVIRRFGGVRVAFIGLTLEGTPAVTVQAGVKGLTFLDEAETVNAQVRDLKARGIQTFVVLLHEGGYPTGLYNGCDGVAGAIVDIVSKLDPAVDVVVTGHTHQAYNCRLGGKLVTSGANNGRIVTDIDLNISENTGDVVTMSANNVIVTRDVAKDPAETALITRYDALSAPFANRIIGVASGDLTKTPNLAGESVMGDVIADAQLEATRSAGAVIAIMNPGGVRADVMAAQISGGEGPGEITYGEAFAVQPFGNLLVTLDVKGADLDTLLEQEFQAAKTNIVSTSTGFTFTYDATRALGDRIDPTTIKLGGEVVSPAGTYRVTVNAFLADGGDGFAVLKTGTNRVTGGVDVDALEACVHSHRPLAIPTLDRVTAILPPAPPTP